jgi:hypothetical protein
MLPSANLDVFNQARARLEHGQLTNTAPAKPGLFCDKTGGGHIQVEVWAVPEQNFGRLTAAEEITAFAGWRAWPSLKQKALLSGFYRSAPIGAIKSFYLTSIFRCRYDNSSAFKLNLAIQVPNDSERPLNRITGAARSGPR